MKTCPSCRATDQPDNANFCSHCGAPLAGAAALATTGEAAQPADSATGLSGNLAGVPYRIVGYEM